MRFPVIFFFASLTACSVSTACAQYGLYGAPNVLPVQQSTAAPAASSYSPQQSAYPTTNGYVPQQYAYPAASTSYPAQPAARTVYQPYQPAAQYRYPTPTCQPTAWTSPTEQPIYNPGPKPIPTPGPAPAPVDGPVYQPLQPAQPQPVYAPQQPQYAAPQNSGPMTQMYPGPGGCDASGCDNGGCGTDLCGPCYEPLWQASFSALVLGRSSARRVWTSNEPFPNEYHQIGNTDIPLSWKWGGEVQLGRAFCCACTPYMIQATFWTTEAMAGSQTSVNTASPYTLGTPLQTGNINFLLPGYTVPATSIFVGADTSTVSRRDEYYNFELNLLRQRLAWASDTPWEIGWSAGVRYFRFQDALSVGVTNPDITGAGDAGDAYFKNIITNNFVGPQIGFDLAYKIGESLRLFFTPKFGIYDNFIDSTFNARARIGSGAYVDGTNTIGHGYPNFPVHGTTSCVAFLTQIDVGADWQFTRNWSARAGYRVVAINNVGLADDQFPQYMADTPEMETPSHASSLLLHGAFFGLTYNF